MAGGSDSAGQPWQGRHFEPNPGASDDGTAPAHLLEAVRRFRHGEATEADVVDAVRQSRLLIPLVAQLGETGTSHHGLTIDKSQELAIVTVRGPDGRTVLPAFTSVTAMSAWDPAARPVPATAPRVAIAAAAENTDLVVLDPTSETEFVIRRPALWALAQERLWAPCYADPEVADAVKAAAEPEPAVVAVELSPGDPGGRLAGPELVITLSLVAGLDRAELDGVVERLSSRWSESQIIADRVDSLRVQVTSAS